VPIYDYLCSHCGTRTEVIHGINDPGPRFCPACGAEGTLRKAMTTPAVHYKGSGWAKKDRSSSSGTRARSGTGSSTGDAADGASKPRDGGSSGGASGEATPGGTKSTDAVKPAKDTGIAASPSED
jgi:putative FmdB family regulatory protein